MDTSETYILQCEKAAEIQKAWEPAAWDWVYCRPAGKEGENPVVLSDYEVDGGYYGHSVEPECSSPVSNGAYRTGNRNFREEHFFIPRQDQLQEMIARNPLIKTILRTLIEEFAEWENDSYHLVRQRDRFNSMEQLWLAFVMHEKGKRWNGEDWVKG